MTSFLSRRHNRADVHYGKYKSDDHRGSIDHCPSSGPVASNFSYNIFRQTDFVRVLWIVKIVLIITRRASFLESNRSLYSLSLLSIVPVLVGIESGVRLARVSLYVRPKLIERYAVVCSKSNKFFHEFAQVRSISLRCVVIELRLYVTY